MGKIMKNGIQYGVGGIQKAEGITYDNTDSGMTATEVQGAIDELNTGLAAAQKGITGVNDRLEKNYYPTAGTYTLELKSGAVYLFVVDRLAVANDTNSGLYIVLPHTNNSHIATIKAASGVTLTISGLVLTITTTVPYMTLSMVRWRY